MKLPYTQVPPLTKEEIEIFLKDAKTARLCSFNKNGTIHAVPLWFKYGNGHIIIASPEHSQKTRNILRNPNVTLLVDIEAPKIQGVIVYGKAKVHTDDWTEEFLSLTTKYMPKNEAEKWNESLSKIANWVKITIIPEHIASFDYEKDDEFKKIMG
ncbi:MAG: pyridoxamine 5'-phosphate oxidase family protein [Candidatus Thorarchaeota archaeon]|nr:MAG: pyridoxamine 5'-phosphate oxidase family protein [Candidatus Thorarchaeota archaeon]